MVIKRNSQFGMCDITERMSGFNFIGVLCAHLIIQIDKKPHRSKDNIAELSEVLQSLKASEFKDSRLINYKVCTDAVTIKTIILHFCVFFVISELYLYSFSSMLSFIARKHCNSFFAKVSESPDYSSHLECLVFLMTKSDHVLLSLCELTH